MTERTWLTLDQGNSALDAVRFTLGADGAVLAWEVFEGLATGDVDPAPAVMALIAERVVEGVAACSVRGAEGQALYAALEGGGVPVARPTPGLAHRLETPETTGLDRLFAARAAAALSDARAIVVIDAGTAMTVDFVSRDEAGGATFEGGAIAPGARTLAASLAARGRQLFEIEPRAGVTALGRSSRAALEAGVVVGLRGAARELARELARASGAATVDVVLAGGDRGLLLAPPVFRAGEALRWATEGATDGATGCATGGATIGQVFEMPLAVHFGLLLDAVRPAPGLPADAARRVMSGGG